MRLRSSSCGRSRRPREHRAGLGAGSTMRPDHAHDEWEVPRYRGANGPPWFSRFSPAARRVLRAAEQECRNHNHYYVGAEHMLFALLEEHYATLDARLAADR